MAGGGCHPDRDIGALIESAGFRIDPLDSMYPPRVPRLAGVNHWRSAIGDPRGPLETEIRVHVARSAPLSPSRGPTRGEWISFNLSMGTGMKKVRFYPRQPFASER